MDEQGGRPVDHYAAFVRLVRARAEELAIPFSTLDAICGFPERYVSTLLCQNKTMSVYSLFTLSRALALMPTFVNDEAQLRALRERADWIESRRGGSKWGREIGSSPQVGIVLLRSSYTRTY